MSQERNKPRVFTRRRIVRSIPILAIFGIGEALILKRVIKDYQKADHPEVSIQPSNRHQAETENSESKNLIINGDFEDTFKFSFTNVDGDLEAETYVPLSWEATPVFTKHAGVAEKAGINSTNCAFIEGFVLPNGKETMPMITSHYPIEIDPYNNYKLSFSVRIENKKLAPQDKPTIAPVIVLIFEDEQQNALGTKVAGGRIDSLEAWTNKGPFIFGPDSPNPIPPNAKTVTLGLWAGSINSPSFVNYKILFDDIFFGNAETQDLLPQIPSGRT